MEKRGHMRELRVNMNYKTGRRGENNCRIVSKGSELDLMYQQVYEDYMKVQKWKEKTEKDLEREWSIHYC